MSAPDDFVTILTATGPLLMTKRISRGEDGQPDTREYDAAKHFDIGSVVLSSLDDLAKALDGLTKHQCIIRGRLREGINPRRALRRLYPRGKNGSIEPATLEPAAHRWLMLDLDSIDRPEGIDPAERPEQGVEHAISLLPPEFRGVSCWWQYTAGQGYKPGLRLRLAYWLDTPVTDDDLDLWLDASPVDPSIFEPAQPIYAARPIFENINDPVPRRSGRILGDRNAVSVPKIERRNVVAATREIGDAGTVGYEHFRAQIGDHADGRGFFAPIKSAVASWVGSHGADADTAELRADLERAVREAERDTAKHPPAYIEARVRDLDSLIARVVEMQGAEEATRKPTLAINAGDLTETARAVGALLSKTGALFVRGGPVKIAAASAETPTAIPLTANSVVIEAHRQCQPIVWNERKKKWGKTTLPERVAKLYLEMPEDWALPPLDGIATTPILRADGGIRTTEGYDPDVRMWCCGVPLLVVPARPSRDDAVAALRLLRRAFRTFPFADATLTEDEELGVNVVDLEKAIGEDESAALMALLTGVCRPSLYLAPGLAVNAPALSGAGVGKGLLVRAICAVAFGTRPQAFTGGHDTAELDKRIVAEAIKASPALFLDNVNGMTLHSDTLASLMTERPACVRVLGETRTVELNSSAFVAVTGNGLAISEDLARRFLTCELDAKTEDPEQRPFRPGFLEEVAKHRTELLTAALTIWRWGRQANEMKHGLSLGSFETWSEWVRDPLLALGCRDPVERIAEAKAKDPRRQNVAQFFEAWWQHHNGVAVKVSDLDEKVVKIIDPQERGRQYVAARVERLTGTRAADFLLSRQEAAGKWGASTYQLSLMVPREVKPPSSAPPPTRREEPPVNYPPGYGGVGT